MQECRSVQVVTLALVAVSRKIEHRFTVNSEGKKKNLSRKKSLEEIKSSHDRPDDKSKGR